MKAVRALVAAILLSVAAYPFQAYSHGGSCRKDSPLGKCWPIVDETAEGVFSQSPVVTRCAS